MTLLWCIATLAPSFFSIKMLARSSRHCEYPDQPRGSHFTMLTPRENLDVDSEDSEPAPHRHSGFRVVAEGGLQLSQFLTRISNKRSSEIRVYSFQSRKPLPMTTKMGDLPLKMSIQIWSEDLAKAIEDGLKSCHVKSADKDDAKDYKSLLHQAYFLMGIFRQLRDRPGSTRSSHSTTLRRGEQSPHPGWRTWSGPKALDEGGHLMIGGHFFPFGSASKGACPALLWLWVADLWQSRFTAVPRLGNEGFQNFHLQFIGRYNYSWTTFWTTASLRFRFTIACGNITVGHFRLRLHVATCTVGLRFERRLPAFPVYNCMWPRGFFSVDCPGFRGNLPESCSGKPTQGATNGLGKPSDEKHHGVHQ